MSPRERVEQLGQIRCALLHSRALRGHGLLVAPGDGAGERRAGPSWAQFSTVACTSGTS